MNTNNHHIDELFARELGNIEIEPPQSVWQAIEKKLDKKKRIGLLYFRIGLAAGFALLFSVSGVYWYNHSSRKDNIVVASKHNSKEISTSSNQKDQANITTSNVVAASNNSTEPVKTSYNTNSEVEVADSEMQATTGNKIEPEDDVYIQADEHSQSINDNVPEQNITLAYLEPKSGIIAMNEPGREPLFDELMNTSSGNDLPTDALLANVETKVKINRWSIEAQVAPQYSYRNITSSSELNADFNNNESGLISYSNAIKVNYQTSKRLTIQAGIAYSVIGQTLRNIYIQQPANNVGPKYSTMSTSSRVNTSLGLINNNVDPEPQYMDQSSSYKLFNTVGTEKISAYGSQNAAITTQSSADIIQRMKVIEIPVMARYYILAGKFNWHITSGLSTNILIGNDALLRNNDQKEKIGETANLKRLNYAGIVGTGFGYALKKNIILTLEPTFKYYLNSISTTGIKVHPYSFGLYTGICYKL